jgi:putative inorganic carbon (hco3(-)) transporter
LPEIENMRIVSYFFSRPIESILFLLIGGSSIILLTTQYYYYAVIPSLALLLIFLIGRYPHIGYYSIIFVIPFSAFRGLSETYKFLRIHWILASILLILIAFQLVFRKIELKSFRSKLWPWFGILFVVSLFSAFVSDFPEASFTHIFFLIVAYMFFTINLASLSFKGLTKTLPKILILSVSLSAFLGILGSVTDIPLFVHPMETSSYKRSIGGSFDPNNLSLMIIFTIPLLAHWFFSSKNIIEKIFIILIFCIDITGIIMTYSRGGAIIFSIILFLIFFTNIKKLKPKHIGFIVLLITFVTFAALIFIPSTYWERQKKVTSIEEDKAIARRVSYLHVGWEAFKEHPIIGSGPGTFKFLYASTNYARMFGAEKDDIERYAHNTYVEYLVGSGVLGLLIFLIIAWISLKNFLMSKNNFKLQGKQGMVSLISAYQISFVSLLIYLFIFSDMYHKYLLVSLALSQVALNLSQDKLIESDGNSNYN